MGIILSHPFGNPNVYQAALALYEHNLLSAYHTCLFEPLGSNCRSFPLLKNASIKTHSRREILRLGLSKSPIGPLNGYRQSCVDWVTRDFDRLVAKYFDRDVDAVYCYEDSAIETFKMAGNYGVRKIYELPIGYCAEARIIADEEVQTDVGLHGFFSSLHEPKAKLVKKFEEVFLADHVICPSTYCCNTLVKHVAVPGRISVLPYGCDISCRPRGWSVVDFRGPLKLVFVGRLDPRKGLHYLFQALERLLPGSYVLTMAGRWVTGYREWLLRRYRVEFKEVGQIDCGQVQKLMRQNHLLVFPSVFEGFGLVLLEALACGIPILASERTGAPDIIQEQKEGFLVRAGSSEDIVSALSQILDEREELAEMGIAARRKAMSLSWTDYRRRLAALVGGDVGGAH